MRLKNGEVCLDWPLANHILTQGWYYNDGSMHQAIDMRALVGTPVLAAEDGTVEIVYHWNGKRTQGDTNSYGNMVKIRHANWNIVFIPSIVLSFIDDTYNRKHLVFSLTTFLNAKKRRSILLLK